MGQHRRCAKVGCTCLAARAAAPCSAATPREGLATYPARLPCSPAHQLPPAARQHDISGCAGGRGIQLFEPHRWGKGEGGWLGSLGGGRLGSFGSAGIGFGHSRGANKQTRQATPQSGGDTPARHANPPAPLPTLSIPFPPLHQATMTWRQTRAWRQMWWHSSASGAACTPASPARPSGWLATRTRVRLGGSGRGSRMMLCGRGGRARVGVRAGGDGSAAAVQGMAQPVLPWARPPLFDSSRPPSPGSPRMHRPLRAAHHAAAAGAQRGGRERRRSHRLPRLPAGWVGGCWIDCEVPEGALPCGPCQGVAPSCPCRPGACCMCSHSLAGGGRCLAWPNRRLPAARTACRRGGLPCCTHTPPASTCVCRQPLHVSFCATVQGILQQTRSTTTRGASCSGGATASSRRT